MGTGVLATTLGMVLSGAWGAETDLCLPSEADDCVRFVSFVDGALNTTYRTVGSVSRCPSQSGVYYSDVDALQRHRSQPTAAELRELYRRRVFPAVKAAVTRYGLSVNGTSCNVAAGLAASALRELGIQGVEVKEGPQHAYVQVTTRDGQTLLIDSTASQFFRDGTAIDRRLAENGFIGTRAELRGMIRDNVQSWNFPAGMQLPGADVLAGVSAQDAGQALSSFFETAEDTYFGTTGSHGLKAAADAQVAFWERRNPNERFIRNVFPTGRVDATDRTRAAYRRLEEVLGR